MRLHPKPFEQIVQGQKAVEARLFDEKRAALNLGDTVIFSLSDDSSQQITVQIKGLSRFASFGDMFAGIGVVPFGYEADLSPAQAASAMEKYYSREEQGKFGVVGIHVKLIG